MSEDQLALQAEAPSRNLSFGNKLRFYGSLVVVTAIGALAAAGCGGSPDKDPGSSPATGSGDPIELAGGAQAGENDGGNTNDGEPSENSAGQKTGVSNGISPEAGTDGEIDEINADDERYSGTTYINPDSPVFDENTEPIDGLKPDEIVLDEDIPSLSSLRISHELDREQLEAMGKESIGEEDIPLPVLGEDVDLEGLQTMCEEDASPPANPGDARYGTVEFFDQADNHGLYSCVVADK